MESTVYSIRQVGRFFICDLLDKRVQGATTVSQAMGKTERQAVRKLNKKLKSHGYRADQKIPYSFYSFL